MNFDHPLTKRKNHKDKTKIGERIKKNRVSVQTNTFRKCSGEANELDGESLCDVQGQGFYQGSTLVSLVKF